MSVKIDTDILNIVSNYIYLFIGIYLIYKKMYIYGLITIIIWLISHMYHTNKCHIYEKIDILIANLAFIFVVIKCYENIFCLQNILLFVVLLIIFSLGWYYYYYSKDIYNILHSIWHIYSGLFVLYLILNK